MTTGQPKDIGALDKGRKARAGATGNCQGKSKKGGKGKGKGKANKSTGSPIGKETEPRQGCSMLPLREEGTPKS